MDQEYATNKDELHDRAYSPLKHRHSVTWAFVCNSSQMVVDLSTS